MYSRPVGSPRKRAPGGTVPWHLAAQERRRFCCSVYRRTCSRGLWLGSVYPCEIRAKCKQLDRLILTPLSPGEKRARSWCVRADACAFSFWMPFVTNILPEITQEILLLGSGFDTVRRIIPCIMDHIQGKKNDELIFLIRFVKMWLSCCCPFLSLSFSPFSLVLFLTPFIFSLRGDQKIVKVLSKNELAC